MLTLKTSIGIAVRGADLEFLCLKRRISGMAAGETMRLENFRAMRPGEAGATYAAFLKRQGMSSANATVSLPRSETLLRVLALPVEAESNLAKAVEYQVDGLHPFDEGGVDYDFTVIHKDQAGIRVAVVMVKKEITQSYYEWFSQAGIPVSGFTSSSPAYFQALAAERAQGPLILLDGHHGRIELLGISTAAVVSKELPAESLERELELCRAQMRLAPEAMPQILTTGDASVPGASARRDFEVYATALAGMGGEFSINLLPNEKRVYRSPWAAAPTYALAALAALLALGVVARGPIQDRLYIRRLETEIAKLDMKVRYVDKLDTQQRKTLDRLLLLRAQKSETVTKMHVMVELTRLLPPAIWLQQAEVREGAVNLTGVADTSASLLPLLGSSQYFRNAEFLAAPNKNQEGKDVFRVRARLAQVLAGGKP